MFANTTAAQAGTDAQAEPTVYERIRNDILTGHLEANARLKVSEIAKRHGTSTNPVREALQQLRGEGLVVISPNQGARVRPIDPDFIRDVYEIGLEIEPYLLRWFLDTVTPEDIAELEDVQRRIEELNFADQALHTQLNSRFHLLMYQSHYNRLAFDLWAQHREIMGALSTRITIYPARKEAIIAEHRELLDAIRTHDKERAVKVLRAHIEDAGKHLMDQLRAQLMRKDAARSMPG